MASGLSASAGKPRSGPNYGGAQGGAAAGIGGFKLPAIPGMPGMLGGGSSVGGIKGETTGPGGLVAKKTATAPTMTPGGALTNTAAKDPRVEAMQNNLASRYNEIKGKENTQDPFLMESVNNLRNRQSQDTSKRAMEQATAATADNAAAAKAAAQSAAARGGRGSGFGGAAIDSASQRLAAKQNSQIQMNELGRQDNLALQGANILNQPSALKLAQSGQANNFLLGAAGQADQGAKLGLAQQGLGLQQWQAGNDASYKQALLNQQGQQGMFDNYLKLMSAGGF